MDLCNSLNAALTKLNINNATCCSDVVPPQVPFSEWNNKILTNPISNSNVMTICQENIQGGMNLKAIFIKDVSGCKGELPDFSMFPSLEKIHIEHCDLTGTELKWDRIPSSNLKELNLVRLELYGQVSPQIQNFQILEKLDLSENRLNGPIPDSLSRLTNLSHMNIAENYLNGTITNVFQNSTKLEYLNASDTLLSGRFNGISSLKTCGMPQSICREESDSQNVCNTKLCRIEQTDQNSTMTIIIIVFVLLFIVMGYALMKFAQDKKKKESSSLEVLTSKDQGSKKKKNKEMSKSEMEFNQHSFVTDNENEEDIKWVQLTTVDVVEKEEKLQPTGSQTTLN